MKASRKQTTAEHFGIEKCVFAAKICYYDIEDNAACAVRNEYNFVAAAERWLSEGR